MGKSEIRVSCYDQVLKITQAPVLAAGGLNEIRVVFGFCEKWAGFIKTAIFYRNEEEVYYAVLDENDTCVVPWEVCYEEGTFYFGVFGERDNTRRTSNVVRYKVRKGAITSDMRPSDPTPGVYDQIIEMLNEIRDTAKHNIASIEKTGTEGLVDTYTITFIDGSTQIYTVTNGEKGDPGYTPQKGVDYFDGKDGKDYVLTGADKKEIAEIVLTTEKLKQMQDDIADLKYVPIAITKITNNVGTVEIGTVVNAPTVSWSLNKSPTKQTLERAELSTDSRAEILSNLTLSENKTFSLVVTDERGASDSATTSIAFLNGVYYGVLESGATIDKAAIQALTKKLQASRGITFTVDAGATQQIIYAIPTWYGTPNFNVGGFDGGFAKATTFNFTNGSGYIESYDVWLSENVGLGSTTVKVS